MKKGIKIFSVLLAVIMTLQSSLVALASTQTVSDYDGKTYTHQSKFDGKNIVYGIDVSEHNGTINFKKVKADGIEYAFIRVGYTGYTKEKFSLNYDKNYKTYIKDALAAGLKVGVYWYSQALSTSEAVKEAEKMLAVIGSYDIEMPVVCDYEFAGTSKGRLDSAKLSKSKMTANALAFLDRVASAGYDPCFYACENFMTNTVNASDIADEYKIWLANYSTKTNYSGDYEFWQHTSSGSVSGIGGRVDVNVWYQGEDVTNLDTQYYTGSPITPEPTVTQDGVTLVNGTDYTLTYSNNTEVGIGNIDVQGIGNYSSLTLKYRFKILPQQVTGLTYVSAANTSLSYSWNAVPGADGYTVYVTNNTTPNAFSKNVTSTSATLNNLTPGNSYTVYVCAKITNSQGRTYIGIASDKLTNSTTGSKVTGVKVSKRTNTTLTLKWNKLSGASYYNVYKYNSSTKKYAYIGSTNGNSNSYKISKLKEGTAYRFKVSAVKDGAEGTKSSEFKTVTSPRKVVLNSAKSKSKKKITVKYKKTTGSGYQVQWSISKSFKGNVKSKTTTKTTYTFKTSKSKKKYYVRVRAYKKDSSGKKIYGKWSKVKSLKVK